MILETVRRRRHMQIDLPDLVFVTGTFDFVNCSDVLEARRSMTSWGPCAFYCTRSVIRHGADHGADLVSAVTSELRRINQHPGGAGEWFFGETERMCGDMGVIFPMGRARPGSKVEELLLVERAGIRSRARRALSGIEVFFVLGAAPVLAPPRAGRRRERSADAAAPKGDLSASAPMLSDEV